MLKVKHNILKIIILLLIVFLLLFSNFFKNIQNILTNDFNKRVENVYGFCGNESIGYLKYIKKKYQLYDNPKIINYTHTPNVSWAIFDPKNINKETKNLILLNYPGEHLMLKYSMIKKNIFTIENLYFYDDKINEINEIIFFFKEKIDEQLSLNIYSESKLKKKKLLKKLDYGNKISDNKYLFNPNLKIHKIVSDENNLIIENEDLKNLEIQKIEIKAKNKIILNNFQLVDNFEKCYLIKND